MTTLIQRSFAGGQISPSMYGRVDLTKWQTGLELCKNFVVQRSGSAVNRPGTKHICSVKSTAYLNRMIKFRYNNAQTFVLLFGQLNMRVIKNGVLLYNGPSPYELVTPFSGQDLAAITYSQSGNIITLCHPSYPPQRLTRVTDTNWTITALSTASSIAAPTSLASAAVGTAYYYVVTAIKAVSFEESVASAEAGSANNTSALTWTAVSGAREYNVFRKIGTGGVYGYIGTTDTNSFTDTNINPNTKEMPPENPGYFGSSGNYPSAVSQYQQRLVFGGSTNEPEHIWSSRTGLPTNFNTHRTTIDSDSISFDLSGVSVNAVKHLIQMGKLIALTDGGEWLISGDADGAFKPTAINARQQSYYGSGIMPPLTVGTAVLYVQARGSIVRDLMYDLDTDGYKGNDLTIFASDLFDQHSFVSWDYAQSPSSVVWMARDDGKFLGLTFIREHQVSGWHQHETDGIVKDICTIPEGSFDATYMIVQRTNGTYVERMADPFIGTDIEDAWFVDCGFEFVAYPYLRQSPEATTDAGSPVAPGNATLDLLGTLGTTDDIVRVDFSSSGSLDANYVGDAIELASTVTLDITEQFTTYALCRPRTNIPSGFVFSGSADWLHLTHRITGLSALNGEEVSILADGSVEGRVTVSGGVATLSRAFKHIVLGIPYVCDGKTLGIENIQGETYAGKMKNLRQAHVQVLASRSFYVGMDFDHMDEMQPRDGDDQGDAPALVSDVIDVPIDSTWNTTGSVCIRHIDPTPLTILSVAYTGEGGG